MAQRKVNAAEGLIENVMKFAGCSQDEAVKIANTYIKLKVVKFDGMNGTYSVKHGAFWEKEVLLRALEA